MYVELRRIYDAQARQLLGTALNEMRKTNADMSAAKYLLGMADGLFRAIEELDDFMERLNDA